MTRTAAVSASSAPLRLITIGFSHYCEKARWALDRSALVYREEDHVPLFHWRGSLAAGGGRTVPVLVTPSAVLRESTQIVRFVDEHLPPDLRTIPEDEAQRAEVMQWVEDLDRGLGPAVRRYIYFHLLRDREAIVELLSSTGPTWERKLARVMFPVIRAGIVRGLKITPDSAERSRQRIDSTFAAVAARLADGRRFLVGDRFSAADLTLAALASPLIQPVQPVQPVHAGFDRPTRSASIPGVAAAVAAARATPAGQHILRMYAEQRPPVRASH